MLNHELRHDDEILVLNPEGPLEADDFTTQARQVDPYLEQHAKLRGVLIRAKSFPSWIDFGAIRAPLKFLKQRIQKIANYFVHAQVQHFDFEREDQVWIGSGRQRAGDKHKSCVRLTYSVCTIRLHGIGLSVLSSEIMQDRSDPGSSPYSRPSRNRGRTYPASRSTRRLPRWLGAGSSNRRPDRRVCRSI